MKIAMASKSNMWSKNLIDKLKLRNPFIEFDFIREEDTFKSYPLAMQAKDFSPDKIIFFHWSTYIDESFLNQYDCYSLHTSNLPDGKGGNPLQNQILEGITFTKVNLIKTSTKMDSGDIYGQKEISLNGSLQDIWMTISNASVELIDQLLNTTIIPQEQNKEGKIYKRLNDNTIPFETEIDLFKIYKIIQMRDAEYYTPSKIKIGKYILEFNRAAIKGNKITCDVNIYHE